MKNTTKLAAILGFMVGTTTALLFTSKKGQELRTSIAKERQHGGFGTTALKKAWVEMCMSAIGIAKETFPAEAIKENVEEVVEEAKTAGRAKMNELVQKARKVIEQEAQSVKNDVAFQIQKVNKKLNPKRNKKQR